MPKRQYFMMSVNGHTFEMEKRGRRWKVACPSFPDLEGSYPGDDEAADVILEFQKRAETGAT